MRAPAPSVQQIHHADIATALLYRNDASVQPATLDNPVLVVMIKQKQTDFESKRPPALAKGKQTSFVPRGQNDLGAR